MTGGNRGIGLATVQALAGLGWTVWLGTRDLALGTQAADHIAGDVRPLQVDVTDDASIHAAAERLSSTGLDVLVNNAALGGRGSRPVDTNPADVLPVYAVNVVGVVRTINAMLPLLRRSARPRIVNVSSSIGSFGRTTDPACHESGFHELVYSTSKAALNMLTTQYARDLPGFLVNAVQPGYTATRLNNFQGTQTVEQGAAVVVRAACLPAEGPTGTFFDLDGQVPW